MDKERKKKASPVSNRLAAIGIEQLCDDIKEGMTYRELSRRYDVSLNLLDKFLNSAENKEQSARARLFSAESWLDRGLEVVESALFKTGNVDASAAKAYEQACARRAALRNPAYRESSKLEVAATVKNITQLTDDELANIATSGSN
jgi:hypothetical protein